MANKAGTVTPVLGASQAELQRSLQASESSAAAAQEALGEKEMELRELKSQKAAEQGLISKEDHEALRLSLQAEINAAAARFNDLTRKHEKTCTEVRASASLRVLVWYSVCIPKAFSCCLKPYWMLLCVPQSELCSMKASFLPLHYSCYFLCSVSAFVSWLPLCIC